MTDKEWQDLLKSTEGLTLVRGKWVEVDPQKLQEALEHWTKVENMARQDGLSFFEGMRLLAGFPANDAQTESAAPASVDREWSGVQAGPWLDAVLAELRDPARNVANEFASQALDILELIPFNNQLAEPD